jgi:hypothetical protein
MMGANRAVVPASGRQSSATDRNLEADKSGSVLTLDELLDALAVLHRLGLSDQIHLVLQDHNVLRVNTDDLQRGEMFSCLGLRA